MTAGTVFLFVAIGICMTALTRLIWMAGTVSAFVAGVAASGIVIVDPALALVAAIVIGAVVVSGVFAVRTGGQVTDERKPTSLTGRLGAVWLVLSFPAVIAWSSLQASHWMLHRG
jgi:hypothetical protein